MKITKEELLKKKLKAYKQFMKGIGRDRICKELHMNHQTLDKWRHKEDWDADFKECQKEMMRKVGGSVAEEKARSLELIRELESKTAEKIQNGDNLSITLSSFAQLQRVKWDLLLPRNQLVNVLNKNDETKIHVNIPKEVLDIIETERL